MKWIGNRKSDNVEDRRGMSGGGKAVVGCLVPGINDITMQAVRFELEQLPLSSISKSIGHCRLEVFIAINF